MGLPPDPETDESVDTEGVGREDSLIPIPVVVIALYQFAKAAYLLYVFYAVWALHRAALAGRSTGPDPVADNPLVLALPVFALIMCVAGAGLLSLARWARQMFLIGGALALPWLANFPLMARMRFGPIVNYQMLQPWLPRTVMLTIIFIDALVYATLLYYPEVAESFGERQGDRYFSGE